MRRYLLILPLLLFLSTAMLPAQSNWQRFRRLSGPEKCWVLSHPFIAKKSLRISQRALAIADSVRQTTTLDGNWNGGQVDAFRHSLWMALLSQAIGPRKARKLGQAHEKGNYRNFRKGKLEDGARADATASEMDLWNNQQGLEAEFENTTEAAIIAGIVALVQAGKMRIIAMDAAGHFLDARGQPLAPKDWQGKWQNDRSLVPSNQLPQ